MFHNWRGVVWMGKVQQSDGIIIEIRRVFYTKTDLRSPSFSCAANENQIADRFIFSICVLKQISEFNNQIIVFQALSQLSNFMEMHKDFIAGSGSDRPEFLVGIFP